MPAGNSVKHYIAPKIDIAGKCAVEIESDG
jgi:hypothetical protein